MKTYRLPSCIVAALILAGTLSAHDPLSPTPILSHQHPVYVKAQTTYALVEPNTKDEITVTWEAKPACPDSSLIQEYTVTIKRTQASKAVYSLWSLGLQGFETATVIESIDPSKVQVAESALGSMRAANSREVVTPTGWRMIDSQNPNSARIVDDKHVWLMEFTGDSFTFSVKRHGRPGMTDWSEQVIKCEEDRNGHDNTPPI